MHWHFSGVNEAFATLVHEIHRKTYVAVPSRAGDVLMVEEPVIVTYHKPTERVLLNEARDANPFFHLYESLWMLAGRNDVAPLTYYNSKMKDFSDDGETFNGAYGFKWRNADKFCLRIPIDESNPSYFPCRVDQLSELIKHLKQNPNSRRAVLQMWTVEDDLLRIDVSKDVCCNTNVYFSVRDDSGGYKYTHNDFVPEDKRGQPISVTFLDMTVCNRSNDLIWGMLGSDYVVFSFLQEYMASCLGIQVGIYNQFTNNLHVYTERWDPDKWLREYHNRDMHSPPVFDYSRANLVPLVQDPVRFDRECVEFVERHKFDSVAGDYREPFLKDVAEPMCIAFHYHKRRQYKEALGVMLGVKADDWRRAGTEWLYRRAATYKTKQGANL